MKGEEGIKGKTIFLRRKGRKHNTMNTLNVGKQYWDVWLHLTKVNCYIPRILLNYTGTTIG